MSMVAGRWSTLLYASPAERVGNARAASAGAWLELLARSGCTPHEFVEELSLALGRRISVDLLVAWCDAEGRGPTPPTEWFIAAARLVGPAAAPVLGGLVA